MRRLDLDAAKTKLKRAKSEKGRSDVSIKNRLKNLNKIVIEQSPCQALTSFLCQRKRAIIGYPTMQYF